MKTKLLSWAIALCTSVTVFAQQSPIQPRVTAQGQGVVKVIPDEATVNISIQNTGNSAAEVKKANDKQTAEVNQFLKRFDLPQKDILTQRVNLSSYVEGKSKKRMYQASQNIQIKLRDLNRLDELISGLTDAGITGIEGVQLNSSKIADLQSEARKLAILHAKKKAEDFAGAVNQRIGKALIINDNSNNYAPRMLQMNAMAKMEDSSANPVIQIGEIEVRTDVYVEFELL